jgi:hypothetical protein
MRVVWVGGPPDRGAAPTPRPQRRMRSEVEVERLLTSAEREWLDRLIEPAERDVWIAAGLGAHDAVLARACIDATIAPHDLSRVVAGCSILERLRAGEPAPALGKLVRNGHASLVS